MPRRRPRKQPAYAVTKRHGELSVALGGSIWEGGAATIVNRGANGRWRKVLTADDRARYEATAERTLGPECTRWLAHGRCHGVPR